MNYLSFVEQTSGGRNQSSVSRSLDSSLSEVLRSSDSRLSRRFSHGWCVIGPFALSPIVIGGSDIRPLGLNDLSDTCVFPQDDSQRHKRSVLSINNERVRRRIRMEKKHLHVLYCRRFPETLIDQRMGNLTGGKKCLLCESTY